MGHLRSSLDINGSPLDLSPFWICSATNRQADPAVAAGQNSYFVAWSDWRDTPATLQHSDIYGSIISAGGIVQQPGGIAICTVTNDQSLPAVTAFGTNFLVVWQDARFHQLTTPRMDIYGARITDNGAVLDPDGFAICTNAAIQTNPVVAATVTRALVVWTDYRSNPNLPDIYGARIDPDGAVSKQWAANLHGSNYAELSLRRGRWIGVLRRLGGFPNSRGKFAGHLRCHAQ